MKKRMLFVVVVMLVKWIHIEIQMKEKDKMVKLCAALKVENHRRERKQW